MRCAASWRSPGKITGSTTRAPLREKIRVNGLYVLASCGDPALAQVPALLSVGGGEHVSRFPLLPSAHSAPSLRAQHGRYIHFFTSRELGGAVVVPRNDEAPAVAHDAL